MVQSWLGALVYAPIALRHELRLDASYMLDMVFEILQNNYMWYFGLGKQAREALKSEAEKQRKVLLHLQETNERLTVEKVAPDLCYCYGVSIVLRNLMYNARAFLIVSWTLAWYLCSLISMLFQHEKAKI